MMQTMMRIDDQMTHAIFLRLSSSLCSLSFCSFNSNSSWVEVLGVWQQQLDPARLLSIDCPSGVLGALIVETVEIPRPCWP